MKTYNNSVTLRNDGVDPSTSEKDLNAGVGINVTVRAASTPLAGQGALALIFDIAGDAIANPLQTDNQGNYTFKAPDGLYDIVIAEGTADENILASVEIVELITPDFINNISLPYDFATRQLMIDSTIIFPKGKRLYVKDIKAEYVVATGASPNFAGSPTIAGGQYAKLQIIGCIHNITHYGAINGAADNTFAMQEAATQAGLLGGVYFMPIGLWIHGQINISSSTIMMGCGYESRDQRLSDVGNATTTQVGYRFFGEQGVAPYPPEENIKAITCCQIHFLGTVVADGFQEFKHLIMMQGATDIDIQTCWFTGWQGDAIVVRSGNFTAAAQNRNVKIKDCVFDGVNNNNRNAISITDVYGMTIRDNKFMNCTRNGELGYTRPDAYDIFNPNKGPAMPGAIDIEPNTGFKDLTGVTDGSTGVITSMTNTQGLVVDSIITASSGFPDVTIKVVSVDSSTQITVDVNSNLADTNITIKSGDTYIILNDIYIGHNACN